MEFKQRRLEFRAWKESYKKMFYNKDIVIQKIILNSHDFIITQLTDFTDKNGKGIWEGDIVKVNKILGIIVFEGGSWLIKIKDVNNYFLLDDNTIVIGNVFENGNLLEEKL